MSAGWIGGNVRGRLLLDRRLGSEGARALAGCGSLDDAVELLAQSAYGPLERDLVDLEDAQHEVAARSLLWLRLLAGWLPRGALEVVRALAAWFELVNVENRLAYLLGGELRRPFDLGSLSTSWPQLALAQSPRELRAALGASAWGDPAGEEPEAVQLALRLSWARRVLGSAPEAGAWAAGAVALLLAREPFDTARSARDVAAVALPGLGAAWPDATSIESLRAHLPGFAAWSLAGIDRGDDLWRAEAAWWRAVESDAEALVRGSLGGRGVVVGVIALLGLDLARVTSALCVASLGDDRSASEALDALL